MEDHQSVQYSFSHLGKGW